MVRFFSDKDRPVHMGPYPLERLARTQTPPNLNEVPAPQPMGFHRPDAPTSIVNVMADYQAMLDATRGGAANPPQRRVQATCKSGVLGGALEHRDFVLSKSQKQNSIILCQSRALDENGVIELDL